MTYFLHIEQCFRVKFAISYQNVKKLMNGEPKFGSAILFNAALWQTLKDGIKVVRRRIY